MFWFQLSQPIATWKIDPIRNPRWTALLRDPSRASGFHTPDWLGVLRRTYGYAPAVITTAPPREPLRDGLVFCRIRSWLAGSRKVSLAWKSRVQRKVFPHFLDRDLRGVGELMYGHIC